MSASKKPRVSIVTPSYNQGQFIERTILSVLLQDYDNLQYIVVDALSKDATGTILDKYAGQIDVVIREKDEGQSDALNKGFALADGEIQAYLNADDCYADANVVSRVVAAFEQSNEQPDLIYGRRYYIDEIGNFSNTYPFRSFNKEQLMKACYLPQECCFWTKKAFDRAGGKITKENHFAMDYDLWLRLLETGAKFEAVDDIWALFRWYPSQKSNSEWESRGLPEIAALHQKFIGRTVSQEEMSAVWVEHYFGYNKIDHPAQSRLFENLWHEEVRLKQKMLGFAPLDHWMFKRADTEKELVHAG